MPTRDAAWSVELRRRTKMAVEEWAMLPADDHVCFKHIRSGYGVIAFADLMRGNLRLIVRDTEKEIVFANGEELIAAGWAID